jgi:CHAD domain-containing protein
MKKPPELDKKIFLERFDKILDNFYQKLQDYIKNPNDESIHDIRVGIRRLETAYRVLPKKARVEEGITNYVKKAKMLFKLNAEIRDVDIICTKLESKYLDKIKDLISTLKNSRIKKLQSAARLALIILDLPIPKICANVLKKSNLNKRYHKVMGKIELDINKNTIISLGDEKRIEELHMLRKDFKKLRYLLELVSYKEETDQVLKNLKEIQDSLGEIHDSDIVINHLKNIKQNSKISDIIKSEVHDRKRKYDEFVSTVNKRKSKTGDFYLHLKD